MHLFLMTLVNCVERWPEISRPQRSFRQSLSHIGTWRYEHQIYFSIASILFLENYFNSSIITGMSGAQAKAATISGCIGIVAEVQLFPFAAN